MENSKYRLRTPNCSYNTAISAEQQQLVKTVINPQIYSSGNKFFLDCYQIIRHIATGGEADVFMAYDTDNGNQRVAILNMKNLQDAENRIDIHQRLNGVEGTVKLLKVLRVNSVDCSKVQRHHMNSYGDILTKKSIFLVTNYFHGQDCVSFLKQRTFSQQMQFFLVLVDIVDQIHQQQVFHFDLKPDNILVSQSGEFCILDFGAAMMVDTQHINIVDPLIAADQPTTNVFKFTPKYAPNIPVDLIVAEKFDVFSLGCILYQLVIHDYCPGAIYRHSRTIQKMSKQFGPLITDLLAGMLDADQVLRYSILEIASHPAFNYFSQDCKSQLEVYHAQITFEARDILFCNYDITQLVRAQSVAKCRNIVQFKEKKPVLCDDCNRIEVERLVRRFSFLTSEALEEQQSKALLRLPSAEQYNLAYYYRLYSDIQQCALDRGAHVQFLRFWRFIERIDQLQSYLMLFRQMVFDPQNAPRDRYYANGSTTNRLSRRSTAIREMFRKSQSSADEVDVRPSAVEWSIESDGNLIQLKEKPKLVAKPFQIQIPTIQAFVPSTAESSEQFTQVVPPPHEAPLDDIFGNYQNIDIEMSTGTMQHASSIIRMNGQSFGSLKKKGTPK